MLGCVVSLTSSHLSGSTIRDVNIGGSVLCSNSSFSSLLSSPNDNAESPSVLLPEGPAPFEDGKEYIFPFNTLVTASVSFSHCHFTGANYESNVRPLTFDGYPGTVSILSCSFENIVYTSTLREGAPKVRFDGTTGRLKMEIEGSVPKLSQKYSVRIRDG
ncbi:hypothetical protein BLNAU_13547 [Blattamonas nauphoetae]|uniref:Uncharacterized protein n=1 Tax=Blattamonas nauphoetae TaxID=2049346 RepID=A0ABQ9XJZ0_9EUKA|nr:hypothetical protein BLNAU_13547 [Blattamonas nauphoetae]